MAIRLTIEQLNSNDKTIWTTVTNYGYRLYTLNMLKSLFPFGLGKKVLLLCLDPQSAVWFQQKGYNVITTDETCERFCAWNTPGYDRICYLKLEWIYRILSLGKNVLLIDGDIVFLKNPMDDVQRWDSNNQFDGWIQNDGQHNQDRTNLCTGYIYIKTSPQMIQAYDCVSDAGKQKYETCAFDNNDQTYFNKYVKPNFTFLPLSLEQYPNGKFFYEYAKQIRHNVTMVHFNWVEGHKKMAKMKEHRLWLLKPDEEI